MYVKIKCNNCLHNSEIDEKTFLNIDKSKLVCSKCGEKDFGTIQPTKKDIYFENDQPKKNQDSFKKCVICKNGIPRERIEALPNANTCVNCVKIAGEQKLKDNQGIIASGSKCPRCKKGIIVPYQNRETKEWFTGCSEFPRCKYTEKN